MFINNKFKIESLFVEQYDRGGLGNKATEAIKKGEEIISNISSQEGDPLSLIQDTINALNSLFLNELNLKQIGQGTLRNVYRIDDDLILKVAKNLNGTTSNKVEMESQKHGYFYRYTPKVFYISPSGYFLISESVNTIDINSSIDFNRWISELDIPDWMKDPEVFEIVLFNFYQAGIKKEEDSYDHMIYLMIEELSEYYNYVEPLSKEEAADLIKEALESNFIKELLRLMKSSNKFTFSRIINDIIPQNVGFNYEGKPVILDHG